DVRGEVAHGVRARRRGGVGEAGAGRLDPAVRGSGGPVGRFDSARTPTYLDRATRAAPHRRADEPPAAADRGRSRTAPPPRHRSVVGGKVGRVPPPSITAKRGEALPSRATGSGGIGGAQRGGSRASTGRAPGRVEPQLCSVTLAARPARSRR